MGFIKAFIKGFRDGVVEFFTFGRWYAMPFWFIIDTSVIYSDASHLYQGTHFAPHLTSVIIWSIIVGIHISACIKMFADWTLKRKHLKRYLILDKVAKEAVDIIDECDGNYDTGRLTLFVAVWNKQNTEYEVKWRDKVTGEVTTLIEFEDKEQTNKQE